FFKYIFFGILSGALLFIIFWLGDQLIDLLNIPITKEIKKLYKSYAPVLFWEYLALVLVAAPGEEIFWRGFVQKRLMNYRKPSLSILAASILYASVQIYSGSILLVFSSFISGLVWGFLYFRKKSMPLVIISHIIFDLMIFIILPFK
ncbi:CPBP family intramembrane glutamic endopeptidase, partial [Bacillus sp. JJ1764]|uniref:CPBP family intramembrane glutamic endopeptidase n=1 Tax=Bacillus sp. JJ1764 TaxID=3122964 RepID=UPI002FFE20BB